MPITILNSHDFVGEVAFIHVEVEAVHGNQFDKGYVISLLFLVRNVIAKHESAAFTRMSMKVNKDLQTLVLLCLLHNSLSSGPNGRIVGLGWCQVHPVEVACHCVQAVVPA